MNRFLRMIGWKDYLDRWDSHEIMADLTLIGMGLMLALMVFVSFGEIQ